ncbi:MAG: Crp/Fnr family transcriptional regulator [Saprospiraceae bacterium]|jgi:CRP/FNR family transcriptional regulator|nr:Crp/Fnr family transcriptional regulator [Saprospiraceae bacterium]
MHIDINLLITYGAVARKYRKNEFIFYEAEACRFYHQVLEGKVKMCCYNDEGRVFIQGLFGPGESFGEPPLFIKEPYPACAQAESDCIIYKLSKDTLFKLMEEYPELQMTFITNFAKKIYEKAYTNKTIISPHPDVRITGFLTRFKKDKKNTSGRVLIPYTRQQLADFLGLRVETVIRTLIKMEEENIVEIRKHKLYY